MELKNLLLDFGEVGEKEKEGKEDKRDLENYKPSNLRIFDVISADKELEKLMRLPYSNEKLSFLISSVSGSLIIQNLPEKRQKIIENYLMQSPGECAIIPFNNVHSFNSNKKASGAQNASNGKFFEYNENDEKNSSARVMGTHLWEFCGMKILVGCTRVVQSVQGKRYAAKLCDSESKFTLEKCVQYYIESVVSGVDCMVIGYERKGLVSSTQMISTEQLPSLFDSLKFDSRLILESLTSVLHSLLHNCKQHYYWLHKQEGEEELRLFEIPHSFLHEDKFPSEQSSLFCHEMAVAHQQDSYGDQFSESREEKIELYHKSLSCLSSSEMDTRQKQFYASTSETIADFLVHDEVYSSIYLLLHPNPLRKKLLALPAPEKNSLRTYPLLYAREEELLGAAHFLLEGIGILSKKTNFQSPDFLHQNISTVNRLKFKAGRCFMSLAVLNEQSGDVVRAFYFSSLSQQCFSQISSSTSTRNTPFNEFVAFTESLLADLFFQFPQKLNSQKIETLENYFSSSKRTKAFRTLQTSNKLFSRKNKQKEFSEFDFTLEKKKCFLASRQHYTRALSFLKKEDSPLVWSFIVISH